MSPLGIKGTIKGNVPISVPCGRCIQCKKRKTSEWSFRLMQQDKTAYISSFVTLTYDTAHVPISKKGYMSVSKGDIQLFFKRLRKSLPNVQVIYFLAAEYGPQTFRPHYHCILFNAPAENIRRAWGAGDVHIGTVTGASVGYTLKYITKPGIIPLHTNDDRQPEFRLMSKGIGKEYLTKAMVSWYKNPLKMTERVYCNIEGGKKISMPRYYKLRLYNHVDKFFIQKDVMEKVKVLPEMLRVNSDQAAIKSYEYRNRQSIHKKL